MIKRNDYLQKLIEWKDTDIIKVVTGVRRCGKSTLFKLYNNYLKKTYKSSINIININLEDLAMQNLWNYQELYNHVSNKMVDDKQNYIFIDEVQNCASFEKAVDSLYIQKNTDIYITGSNAYMLSGELATLLSGRYITIDMLPLSFREYFGTVKSEKSDAFNSYLQFGSFPYVTQLLDNTDMIKTYIDGIYSTIVIKDIAKRENITDIALLESIIKTLLSSIGSPISANKIANTIISSGRKISSNTVEHYLKCLVDSYLFYKVDRYDIKGRSHLRTHGKYYVVDTGLRNLLSPTSSTDIGHVIENIVYLELKRRKYTISIGKVAENEVDFVATNGNETMYIQVSASVLDPNTLQRELVPLQKIRDNHPKILLTLDIIGKNSNYDGIKQLNLIDWLLEETK